MNASGDYRLHALGTSSRFQGESRDNYSCEDAQLAVDDTHKCGTHCESPTEERCYPLLWLGENNMRPKAFNWLITAAILFSFSSAAFAQTPRVVRYTGVVRDAAGAPARLLPLEPCQPLGQRGQLRPERLVLRAQPLVLRTDGGQREER